MKTALTVDLELVKKYNLPGPRYTSYPPATRFTNRISEQEVIREIKASNETANDLSIYFHIPFCQSLCWYCGCNTIITRDLKQSAIYLEYLKKEAAQIKRVLNVKRPVVQIHWGGGTPTYLSPGEINALGELIRNTFAVTSAAETSVEVDPRRLSREHIIALRQAGFNRISIGVQDFDPRVQKAVHRFQPFAMTKMAVDWARAEGFQSVNLDLMYGLPYQTVESFEETLDQTLQLAPDRLAVFSYAHVPWIKPAQSVLERALPSPEVKLEIFKMTLEKLTGSGDYAYIGMDHFARVTDDLAKAQENRTLRRNFQGYSTCGGTDIFSFGMSAISQTPNAYWQNEKELDGYYKALNNNQPPVAKGMFLTEEDQIRRAVIMRVMCDLRLDFGALSEQLGIRFEEHFANELESLGDLEEDGLIRLEPDCLEVTPSGRLLIRNIAMRFDAYMPLEKGGARFSKTI